MNTDRDSPPTVDQLRHRIDAGETGEKIEFPDPAAAPLGTDAEAAGNPPSTTELRLEQASQPAVPAMNRWPDDKVGILVYCVAVFCLAAAIVVIATLA